MSTCFVIHGTWGKRSDFAFDDSLFCRAIKAATTHRIDFERFSWSGRNSSVERLAAAERLRNRIAEASPNMLPIYIIAHSHGGNVALDAARDDRIAKRIGGIVTLGTPFLHSVTRHWVTFLGTAPGKIGAYTILFALIMTSVFTIAAVLMADLSPMFGLIGALILAFMFWLTSKSTSENPLDDLYLGLLKRSRNILIADGGTRVNARFLVVHSQADEALWWLQQVFSISTLPFIVLSAGLWIVTCAALVSWLSTCVAVAWTVFGGGERVSLLLIPPVVTLVFGCSVAFFGMTFAVLVKGVQRFLGTGRSNSLWSEITTGTRATKLPYSDCQSVDEWEAPMARVHGGLWHSKYMRSGEVIDRIAQTLDKWSTLVSVGKRS